MMSVVCHVSCLIQKDQAVKFMVTFCSRAIGDQSQSVAQGALELVPPHFLHQRTDTCHHGDERP